MGFNKVILQSPHELINEYKTKGRDGFLWRYSKYDAFMGSVDSITFINTIFDFKDESSEEIINHFISSFEREIETGKN